MTKENMKKESVKSGLMLALWVGIPIVWNPLLWFSGLLS